MQTRKRPATLGIARKEMERRIPLTRVALTMARTVTSRRTMEPTQQSTDKRRESVRVEPTGGEMKLEKRAEYDEK